MGFWDFLRSNRGERAEPRLAPYTPAGPHPSYRIRGNRGTQLSGGKILGIEKNPKLSGDQWVDTCQEMLRTDPIVATSWRLIKQTLLSASWEWTSADETNPEANALAEFANCNWGLAGWPGEMEISWEEQLDYLTE